MTSEIEEKEEFDKSIDLLKLLYDMAIEGWINGLKKEDFRKIVLVKSGKYTDVCRRYKCHFNGVFQEDISLLIREGFVRIGEFDYKIGKVTGHGDVLFITKSGENYLGYFNMI